MLGLTGHLTDPERLLWSSLSLWHIKVLLLCHLSFHLGELSAAGLQAGSVIENCSDLAIRCGAGTTLSDFLNLTLPTCSSNSTHKLGNRWRTQFPPPARLPLDSTKGSLPATPPYCGFSAVMSVTSAGCLFSLGLYCSSRLGAAVSGVFVFPHSQGRQLQVMFEVR